MLSSDFTIGWICALPHELAASRAMLDFEYEVPQRQDQRDENRYRAGKIGDHNVIMACLPAGKYGIESAAIVAKDLYRSFKSIRFGLMVGIGGGVPTATHDIRLGDVVVSKPTQDHGGVLHYDIYKVKQNGAFERKGHLNKPPLRLLAAISDLQATHEMQGHSMQTHLESMQRKYPNMEREYGHPLPESDKMPNESGGMVDRKPRNDPLRPHIHYGLIASGNRLIKSAAERDRLQVDGEILCFEMEAAGLMDWFPCLVVRGVCDYSDAYKEDTWQKYAAATAAAYSKELLLSIPSSDIVTLPSAAESEKTSKYKINFAFYDVEPVEDFIGRDDAMTDLEEYFSPGSPDESRRKIFVIQGMGGIGKTQLCLNYFRKHKSTYTACVWINGSTHDAVKRSFRDLAKRLSRESDVAEGIQDRSDDDIKQAVMSWLERDDNSNWLLVIDNLDLNPHSNSPDPQAYDVQQYIPKVDHGSIVITSRLQSLNDLGRFYPLQELDDSQSQMLLGNKVARSLLDDGDAQKTISRLQGLPLALTLAGAYIRSTGQSFASYNKRYDQQWATLFQRQDRHKVPQYADRRMLTTWVMSYDQVKNESQNAALLFDLWAFLSPSNLSYDLLKHIAINPGFLPECPPWLSNVAASENDFMDEVAILLQYSLVSKTGTTEKYLMHGLVHEWSFHMASNQRPADSMQLFQVAVKLLSSRVPLDTFDSTSRWRYRTLSPHSSVIARRMDWWKSLRLKNNCSVDLSAEFDILGYMSREMGRYGDSTDFYEAALQGKEEEALGPEHSLTLRIINNLGVVYGDQGKLDAAEKMFQRALQGYKKTLGPEHPLTFSIASNLGTVYYDQGKLDIAEKMFQQALGGKEKALGREHSLTLCEVNNLANLYRMQGKVNVAEELYKRELRGHEKVPGSERSIIRTLNNLGILYSAQGELEAAERMFQRALQGYEKAFGPEHSLTPEEVNDLGNLYRTQGKLDVAEEMYKRALQGREEASGPNHPSTLGLVGNLGNVYRDQGKLDVAEEMYQRALQGKEKELGPEHLWTLDTIHNFGHLYEVQGKLAAAEEMYQRALRGYATTVGTNSSRFLKSSKSLQRCSQSLQEVGKPKHTSHSLPSKLSR